MGLEMSLNRRILQLTIRSPIRKRKLCLPLTGNSEDTEEKKPVDKPDETSPSSGLMITGFRFFDMEVLCDVLSMLGCHQCGELDLLFMEDEINRKGCASSLHLLCKNCGWKYSFYTSRQQGKSFEVNRRLVYGMRTLGKGHTGAQKFCTLMNMPPPPAAKNYSKISGVITSCLRSIGKESMSYIIHRIHKWQLRGTTWFRMHENKAW